MLHIRLYNIKKVNVSLDIMLTYALLLIQVKTRDVHLMQRMRVSGGRIEAQCWIIYNIIFSSHTIRNTLRSYEWLPPQVDIFCVKPLNIPQNILHILCGSYESPNPTADFTVLLFKYEILIQKHFNSH